MKKSFIHFLSLFPKLHLHQALIPFYYRLMGLVCVAGIIGLTPIAGFSQSWNQLGNDINGEAEIDESGHSVSMPDHKTVAIGGIYNAVNGANAGQTRVFRWNGTAWVQKGAAVYGEAAGDYSGFSVSMPDSITLAIGSYANSGAGVYAGHTRVFTWSGTSWVQKGTDIDAEAGFDQSGHSVSMSDPNTLAIGAIKNSGSGAQAGHVRVYKWSGSSWVQKGQDLEGEAAYDEYGHSVCMPDSNTVAIGSIRNSAEAGHVRVYSWNGSVWLQKGIDLDGESAGDNFGHSVSMPDANTLAIGARFNSATGNDAGHVRVFSWNGSAWSQMGGDIDGEAADDRSGFSVSMPDINTLAIGAEGNDGSGFNSGHARVYRWNGAAWEQKGLDIDGEDSYNYSGWSVSMPDSNTLAIGAPDNNGTGPYSGHVRVYSYVPGIGWAENNFGKEFSIYPNPSQGIFQINLGKEYSEVRLVVRNLSGQIIQEQFSSSSSSLDLNIDSGAGVYLVEINEENGRRAVFKVVLE